MFLFLVFFLRRGNGLTAKMEFIMTGRTKEVKEYIDIHEELMVIQQRRDNEIRILIS